MPKPLLPGEVASSEAKMSERLYRAAPALFRSLERRPLSNLSVSHPLDSSPGRRALGKEGSFSMKPTGAYWKTSRDAKASPARGGGIERERRCRRGCTEQHLRYSAHSKGVLCPTSQSRFRSTAPLKRGAIDKEISFRSNTRCCDKTSPPQSLSLWERWHGEAVTERARMLTKSKKHSDTISVCQRHRIAVFLCFILPGLPSQALARQLSQRESPWQRGQALVYASMPWSAGG